MFPVSLCKKRGVNIADGPHVNLFSLVYSRLGWFSKATNSHPELDYLLKILCWQPEGCRLREALLQLVFMNTSGEDVRTVRMCFHSHFWIRIVFPCGFSRPDTRSSALLKKEHLPWVCFFSFVLCACARLSLFFLLLQHRCTHKCIHNLSWLQEGCV